MRVRSTLMCVVAALACSVTAYANNYQYAFTFTGQPGPGQIQSFSFSFTTSSLISPPPDSSPAFTPFTITDGTHSWTITKDLVGFFFPTGCFGFGTSSSFLTPSGCNPQAGGVTDGAFTFEYDVALPNAPGTYIARMVYGELFWQDQGPRGITTSGSDSFNGTESLTITDLGPGTVPEPSSVYLLGSAFAVLVPLRRRLWRN